MALDPLHLIRVLNHHGVQYIVVGGAAAVLHGAPITTKDLDVLFLYSQENREKLLQALTELDAHYLDPAGRKIPPNPDRMEQQQLHLLNTRLGRLDLIRTIGNGLTYEDVLQRSSIWDFDGEVVTVADLAPLIELKEVAGRPKDLQALPFLRELLDRQNEES